MSKPIVIWGAKGHAKVLREFLPGLGYELIAVFDKFPDTPQPFDGIPLHIGKEAFAEWRSNCVLDKVFGLVAIGGQRGQDRIALNKFFTEQNVTPVTVTHPTAFVAANAEIGIGSQILAQSAVGVEVRMGESCIINTSASVDHESTLGQGVHIAPGATLAGCVTVGDLSHVGAGAVILPRVTIGKNAIVGAGSVVTKDVPDNHVVCGNPATFLRDNN